MNLKIALNRIAWHLGIVELFYTIIEEFIKPTATEYSIISSFLKKS